MLLTGLQSTWAVADELPNLVVYLADDLSARDIGTYGSNKIATPAIDQLAADGMTFERAFVASPSCAPSRAAMLTGLMPARNGAEENHTFPNRDLIRLPSILATMGYQTAAFGKVTHEKKPAAYGFETSDLAKDFPVLRENVHRFLSQRTDERPLALFVGTSSPHVPWPDRTTVDPNTTDLPPNLLDTPRTRVQRSRYLQEVIELDAYLGELRELTQKHLNTDTVFVFSSDHGAQFPFSKWTLYDEGIRVPLIVSWPERIAKSSRTTAMVSWVDLLPTLIDVAGGEVPIDLDGRSFASILFGKTSQGRKRIFTTHSGDRMMNVYPIRSIRTDRFKYIRNLHPEFAFTTHIDLLLRETSGDYFREWTERAESDSNAAEIVAKHHGRPAEELYDVLNDPYELENLAGQSQHKATLQSLSDELDLWISDQGDKLTVFHEPLQLNAPTTWVPRKR